MGVGTHALELKGRYDKKLVSAQELWNSDFTRNWLVHDALTLSLGGSAIALLGFSGSLNATWLTRGPEASFMPTFTVTAGWKAGFELSSGPTVGIGNKIDNLNRLSPVEKITMESMLGYGVEGSASYGLGGTIGVGLDDRNRPSWLNGAIGVGEAGGAAGVTYTMRVTDVVGILIRSFQQ